ncbi:hypothetical protein CRUP_007584 [Coryphaenoides rupestris]|nr:hypothetical protein CRUP_007584 [Coryphaenoides rupestris]
MDPGDSSSSHLKKRQRAPLSDSEDNVFSSSEGNDGQKRLRLDHAGQENRSPTPSCSRPAEQAVKPDTPAIKSVRLLVQQLTQRPGGEDEFHQRLERFKAPPLFQASPSLVPPGSCSDFVSGIKQKLQGNLTPSSKQAALIRQGEGDANPADGSFTETLASKKQMVKTTGDKAPCDPLPAANLVELESLSELEERMCREPESPKVQRNDTEQEQGGSVREDEVLGSHGPHWSTSKLFIDEEQSVLASPPGEEVSGQTPECLEVVEDGASESPLLEVKEERRGGSSHGEEEMELSTDEELRLWKYPRAGGDGRREAPVEASEERGEEPEGESSAGEEQEKSRGRGAQPDVRDGDDGHLLACDTLVSRCTETRDHEEEAILKDEPVESEISPSANSLKTEKAVTQSNIDAFHGDPEACDEEPMHTVKQQQQEEEGDLEFKEPAEPLSVAPCGRTCDQHAVTDDNPALCAVVDEVAPMDLGDPPDSDPNDAAQTQAEVRGAEREGSETGLPGRGHRGTGGPPRENQMEEAHPPEGQPGGNKKKVTFILEPELINDSILSESNIS